MKTICGKRVYKCAVIIFIKSRVLLVKKEDLVKFTGGIVHCLRSVFLSNFSLSLEMGQSLSYKPCCFVNVCTGLRTRRILEKRRTASSLGEWNHSFPAKGHRNGAFINKPHMRVTSERQPTGSLALNSHSLPTAFKKLFD